LCDFGRHARAQEARKQYPDYVRLQANRKKLPAHNYEEEVCQLIENNQIILISGETGCGKTTQVPQFILDHPGMGPTARVLVTQPRRISGT
jgi:ATP-dependent RNA helicase DHX36